MDRIKGDKRTTVVALGDVSNTLSITVKQDRTNKEMGDLNSPNKPINPNRQAYSTPSNDCGIISEGDMLIFNGLKGYTFKLFNMDGSFRCNIDVTSDYFTFNTGCPSGIYILHENMKGI